MNRDTIGIEFELRVPGRGWDNIFVRFSYAVVMVMIGFNKEGGACVYDARRDGFYQGDCSRMIAYVNKNRAIMVGETDLASLIFDKLN